MSGIVGSRFNIRGSGLVGSLGTDGQVFTSSGAGVGAVYEAGGVNTPAFQANLSGNLSISHSTTTKVAFDTETYDSDGCYDPSTNYRFTPAVVGKYLIYVRMGYNEHSTAVNSLTDQAGFYCRIYKNGTSVADVGNHSAVSSLQSVISANAISIVDLDADDYVEAYTLIQNNNNNNAAQLKGNVAYCEFGGFKMVT